MPGPLGFVVAFLIFLLVAAIVIVGVRWLLSLAGATVSPQLNLLITLVMILLLIVLFFYGVPWHAWGFGFGR